GEKDFGGLEISGGADTTAFAAFAKSVGSENGAFVGVANSEKKIVDRVLEVEELNVRLKAKLELAAGGCRNVFGFEGWRGGAVESFDIGPFEADDVEGETLLFAGPLRMLAKPGFELGAEIAQREGRGRAIDEVGLGHGVEFLVAKNGAEAGKVFLHSGED